MGCPKFTVVKAESWKNTPKHVLLREGIHTDGLKPIDRCCVLWLASHAEGYQPTRGQMLTDLGVSPNTLDAAMRRVRDAGWVVLHRLRDDTGALLEGGVVYVLRSPDASEDELPNLLAGLSAVAGVSAGQAHNPNFWGSGDDQGKQWSEGGVSAGQAHNPNFWGSGDDQQEHDVSAGHSLDATPPSYRGFQETHTPLPPTEVPEVAAAVLPPDIVAEIDADTAEAIAAEVRRRLDGGATLDELAEVARASELYTAKSVVAVLRARWRKWAKARRQAATRPTGAVSASESVAWGAPASTDPEAVEGAQRPAEARQGVCVSSLGKRASATALEAAARGVIGTLADRPTGLERRALLRAVGELVLAGWPPDHLASCLRHDGTEDVATIKRRAVALAEQSVPTFEDAT